MLKSHISKVSFIFLAFSLRPSAGANEYAYSFLVLVDDVVPPAGACSIVNGRLRGASGHLSFKHKGFPPTSQRLTDASLVSSLPATS